MDNMSKWALAHLVLWKPGTPNSQPDKAEKLGVVNGGRKYWGRADSLQRARVSAAAPDLFPILPPDGAA